MSNCIKIDENWTLLSTNPDRWIGSWGYQETGNSSTMNMVNTPITVWAYTVQLNSDILNTDISNTMDILKSFVSPNH